MIKINFVLLEETKTNHLPYILPYPAYPAHPVIFFFPTFKAAS